MKQQLRYTFDMADGLPYHKIMARFYRLRIDLLWPFLAKSREAR
jgi:hypothetical protein